MSRASTATGTLLVIALMLSGCSSAAKGGSAMVDDFARSLGTSTDDVLEPLERQAAETGTSVDSLASQVRNRADDVPAPGGAGEVRSRAVEVACSAVVDSIGTYRENGAVTQLDAVNALYDAVLAQNTSAGVQDTLEDIETALLKLYNGQDADIDLLVISLAYCS